MTPAEGRQYINPNKTMFESIFKLSVLAAIIDIAIVSVALYYLMLLVKGTRAERMLWGLGVIVLVYFVSQRVELVTLHWILSNFLGSIVIFIIVVFQQDIRRALAQMGKVISLKDTMKPREVLEETVNAVRAMSLSKTGALIVIERGVDLGELGAAGVDIDAKVSEELLRSIFNTASPMHDGAVVIRRARLFKAGCILPLTEKELAESLGTRHRAAIGLAEETDAVVIVVSEMTGEIMLATGDELFAGVKPEELLGRLKRLFPDESVFKKTI